MIIPGSNLLNMARRLIKFQTIQYYQFQSRVLNSARQWVPSFADPIPIQASVQAVDRNRYLDMGLDFNSQYIQLWAPINMVDLTRDSSGDRLVWNGDWYQMKSEQSWWIQDGWAQALAVRIGSMTVSPSEPEKDT